VIVQLYLHGHSGRTQYRDQFHVDNQDHSSTKEFEKEYQVGDLQEF